VPWKKKKNKNKNKNKAKKNKNKVKKKKSTLQNSNLIKNPILVFLDLAVTKFLYSVILPLALWPLDRLSL